MCKSKIRSFVERRLSGDSTAARWGVFATAFSIGWAFVVACLVFVFSFGGCGMMVAALILGLLGVGLVVFAIAVGNYWFKHPLTNTTTKRLGKIEKSIEDLTEEIRRDRNERNKKSR